MNSHPTGFSSLIFTAVANGHEEMVKLLITQNADVNVMENNQTPLQYAMANDLDQIALLLIHAGGKANNMLHLAIQKNKLPFVKAIVTRYPHLLEQVNDAGQTPLFLAAQLAYEEILQYLLDHGASPNCMFKQQTPLLCALEKDRDNIALMLIQAGANPDLGLLPSGMAEKMKAWLDRHATLIYIETPIKLAALGDLATLKKLLKKDPSLLEHKDEAGKTPLYYAAENGHASVVEFLLQNFANPNVWAPTDDPAFFATPLYRAVQRGHIEVVKKFLAAGIAQDSQNYTSIHDAAQHNHIEAVKSLIEAHPHLISSINAQGKFPIELAARNDHVGIVKLLLDKGAKINIKNVNLNELSPYNYQFILDHSELLATFIKAGYTHPQQPFILEQAIFEGCTTLIKAIFEKNPEWLDMEDIKDKILGYIPVKRDALEIFKIILEKRPQFFKEAILYSVPVLQNTVSSFTHHYSHPEYLEVVALLIAKGATINAETVHTAAYYGGDLITLMLIQAGFVTTQKINGRLCSNLPITCPFKRDQSNNFAFILLQQIEGLDQFIKERSNTADYGKSHSIITGKNKSLLEYVTAKVLRGVIVEGDDPSLLANYKETIQQNKMFSAILNKLDNYLRLQKEIKVITDKIKVLLQDLSDRIERESQNKIPAPIEKQIPAPVAKQTTAVIVNNAYHSSSHVTTASESAAVIATTIEEQMPETSDLLYPSIDAKTGLMPDSEKSIIINPLVDLEGFERLPINLNTLYTPSLSPALLKPKQPPLNISSVGTEMTKPPLNISSVDTEMTSTVTPKPQEVTPKSQEVIPKSQEVIPKSQEVTPKPQEKLEQQQEKIEPVSTNTSAMYGKSISKSIKPTQTIATETESKKTKKTRDRQMLSTG